MYSRGEGYVYVSVHVCVCTVEERVCVSVGVYTAEGSVFVCVYSRWKSVCVCVHVGAYSRGESGERRL